MEHRRLSDDGSANCKRWCRGANTRPRLCPWEGEQGSCRGEEPGEGSDPSHSACRASPAAPPAAGHRLDTAPSTLFADLQTGREESAFLPPGNQLDLALQTLSSLMRQKQEPCSFLQSSPTDSTASHTGQIFPGEVRVMPILRDRTRRPGRVMGLL